MLELTSDLFPLPGPGRARNGFHEGLRGPVTFEPSVRWLDGRLMATCHFSSASITLCLSVFIGLPCAEVICVLLHAFWK